MPLVVWMLGLALLPLDVWMLGLALLLTVVSFFYVKGLEKLP
jgi:hypothetical protein